MNMLEDTPWDAAVFGIHTAQIIEYSEAALNAVSRIPGHYTIKVDSLSDKRLLYEHGFYYCDTLIVPSCTAQKLVRIEHPDATVLRQAELDDLLPICHGAFVHGRFHRDFNLGKMGADLRYDNWLKQFHEKDAVYGLYWRNELAGFIAHDGSNLVLHALAESQRGRGRAKYWWSAVSSDLLAIGHDDVRSSISAANLSALNLYASLGFTFCQSMDVYHRLVK